MTDYNLFKNETNNDPLALYQKRVKQYELESKDMSALEKHVFLFLDKNKTFSPTTVAKELKLMHGEFADLKGFVISLFNASHPNFCPAMNAEFKKDANGYARFLHLGTTRIWNPDGSINEERMQQFKDFVTKGQENTSEKIVTLSKLKEYLSLCLKTDPEETKNGNGRNTVSFFSSRKMQSVAATAAWDEIFDRLAGGYTRSGEPYLTEDVAEEFFRDSPKAFLRAECGLLPAPKPSYDISLSG